MRISTKCSIALHLLILINVFGEQKLTSEFLAGSTGCNPVMVRNTLGSLKNAGIIDVRRGTGGAVMLADPEKLTVWQVFEAVDGGSLDELIGLHPSPSGMCPVGRNIYALLEKPYGEVAESVKEAMSKQTLGEILKDYRRFSEKSN